MVSTRPLISKFSCPFNNPLVIVPKAPITVGIIVTLKFYSFFNSLAKSRYLSFYSLSFNFIQWSAFLSEVAVNHLKTARGEIWPKRSEKNNKNYQDEDKSPQ